jgi:outer membrane immunogenic protein
MKKFAFALAASAVFAGPALAADMAVKARPAPAPVVVANWTGCYIGGGGGYGLFDQENTGYADIPFTIPRTRVTPTADAGGRGWFGTVGGGCDYQFGGIGTWQVVIGAFADYDFADLKGQLNLPTSTLYGTEKLTDKWSVGGRIGVLITPQLLTYISGGYTEAKYAGVNFDSFANTVIVPQNGQYWNSQWYKGWFLGSGYEYALGFLPGLYWKTEYRFSEYDVGTNRNYFAPNFIVPALANTLTGASYDSKKYDHTVRSSLVWRFNWGGSPVVAKY